MLTISSTLRWARRTAAAAAAVGLGLGLVAPPGSATSPDRSSDPADRSRPRDPIGLARDVNPGPGGIVVDETAALGRQLVLSLGDGRHGRELWRSDGSPGGTRLLADINPGRGPAGRILDSEPRGLTRVGDHVYFVADTRGRGEEVWRTDGTRAGTTRVTDMPGRFSVLHYTTAAVGRTFYFVADDGVHGREVWRTDGSAAGARMVSDVHPGRGSAQPFDLTSFGGRVYFRASDGEHGSELWATDGTAAGTTMVADIWPGAADPGGPDDLPNSSAPAELTVVKDTLYFVAIVADDVEELWTTDGTGAGTERVRITTPVGDIWFANMSALGDRLVYQTYDDRDDGYAGRTRLWSAAGGQTRQVGTVQPVGISQDAVGGVLLMSVWDQSYESELWRTDGTKAGTRLVEEITPGAPGSTPERFTRVGDRLFFGAGRGDRRGIWSSDGTARGTRPFAVLDTDGGRPGGETYFLGLAAAGGRLFADLGDEVYGRELWSTAPAATTIRRLNGTVRPRVVGRPEVGNVLTVAPGRWAPEAGLRRSYRWYVDGRATAVTSRTFRLRLAQAGSVVRVRELAAKPGWRTQASYSAATAPVRR